MVPNSKLALSRCVSQCDLGLLFWTEDKDLSTFYSLIIIVSSHSLPTFDLCLHLTPSRHHFLSVTSFSLPLIVSLYLKFLLFSFPHSLSLSLFLSLTVGVWKTLCLTHERKVLLHFPSSLLIRYHRKCGITPRHTLTFTASILSYIHSVSRRPQQCSSMNR